MSHGFELEGRKVQAPPAAGVLGMMFKLQARVSGFVVTLSMIAMLVACVILTSSVVLRYFLKIPTDWQDEASVFLLVGVIFPCPAHVQSLRGHIGI